MSVTFPSSPESVIGRRGDGSRRGGAAVIEVGPLVALLAAHEASQRALLTQLRSIAARSESGSRRSGPGAAPAGNGAAWVRSDPVTLLLPATKRDYNYFADLDAKIAAALGATADLRDRPG